MEHIMNLGTRRKVQPIGNLANALKNLKRPCILGPQLSLWTINQGQGLAVKKTQPHPVPNSKLQLPVMVIVVALGVFMCLQQAILNFNEEYVVFP